MAVKAAREQVRPTAKPNPQAPRMQHKTFPAPTRGWVTNENLALAQPAGASVLDNWFPTATGIRTRGGSLKYATISTGPVTRMWTYKSGQVEEFFAADEENIFNITTIADPDIIPTAGVTGQSAGYYSTTQIGTAGGNYLYAVNGADDAQLYDGSVWLAVNSGSTPAITGVTTSSFSFVWLYASRLYFVEKDTLSAWYLPVDAIGGAATEFSLAGIFQEGGYLLFGGKWSLDSGDGLDDKCVFVSSEGEVAVYQGLYPGDAGWQKVGVYQIAPPMGPNATMQAGGDLLIATEAGIVPISEAVRKDAAALDLSAVTRNIEPEWRAEVVRRKSLPWEIIKWPTRNMMIVSLPVPDDSVSDCCFAANLQTGAWAGRFTGWNTRSIAHYADNGYRGTNDGSIYMMDTTGSDDGDSYVCTYVGLPDHLDSPGVTKTVHQMRAIFKSNVPFIAKISASTDYQIDLPSAPSSVTDFTVDVWDVGLWDVAQWDAASTSQTTAKWVSIGKTGFSVSPQAQITCGVTPTPTTELVAFDALFENGTVMT